jgi:hypothetical protein
MCSATAVTAPALRNVIDLTCVRHTTPCNCAREETPTHAGDVVPLLCAPWQGVPRTATWVVVKREKTLFNPQSVALECFQERQHGESAGMRVCPSACVLVCVCIRLVAPSLPHTAMGCAAGQQVQRREGVCSRLNGLRVLLRLPPLLSHCLQSGMTPLHIATINGDVEDAKKLIAEGADLEAVDTVRCARFYSMPAGVAGLPALSQQLNVARCYVCRSDVCPLVTIQARNRVSCASG